ncbi:MAG: putative hydro-lyase [Christensenellaceae bacterium]|nr:putative hydro-lyase [Christensenellaceae bacterium]
MKDFYNMKPSEVRAMFRSGELCRPTAGMCGGYAQGNLAILPKEQAFDFLLFTQRNPKPCPILEVSDVGSREFALTAPGSDIAKDISLYRVYENGELTGEYQDISQFWRDDFVSFLIGCSFTFESALMDEDVPVRHIEMGCNVPMYITNLQCKPAGEFFGPAVVSMRPIPRGQVMKAISVTGRYPSVHGAPVHVGDPSMIGIKDVMKPDFGDPVEIREGEIPVFWACGVTPQAVAMNVKPPIMITHAPGHMFITDIKNSQLSD